MNLPCVQLCFVYLEKIEDYESLNKPVSNMHCLWGTLSYHYEIIELLLIF